MRYSGYDWTVEPIDVTTIKMTIVNPPEQLKGRTLVTTPAGTFECKRDGTAKPIELMDCNPQVFITALSELAKTKEN